MYIYLKRIGDLVFSVLLLILLSPVFLAITIILLISTNDNPFFTQRRPGKNEKIFSILKFKTMTDEKDANGNLLPDIDRLTRLGIFLRKTSLDEIPQLINIVKGEMSFIGPRPLLIRYLPYYTSEEKLRHQVRPGITGLAQISGRNFLPWNERLGLDVEYVKNQSFYLDALIFFKTIKKVISQSDIELAQDTNMVDLNTYRSADENTFFIDKNS